VLLELLIRHLFQRNHCPNSYPVYRIYHPHRRFSQASFHLPGEAVISGQQNIDEGLFGTG
jgi:hypothetical protein